MSASILAELQKRADATTPEHYQEVVDLYVVELHRQKHMKGGHRWVRRHRCDLAIDANGKARWSPVEIAHDDEG